MQASVATIEGADIKKLTNVSGDQIIGLPEKSLLEKVIYRPLGANNITITCGWSAGSSEIISSKTIAGYPPDGNDPTSGAICISKTIVFVYSNSLNFRITGGNADITVLYRKNVFN